LLRSKGIPTFIQDEYTSAVFTFDFGSGLFVLLDSQYNDAIELARNPSHWVEEPISEEDIVRLEDQVVVSKNETRGALLKYGMLCLVVLVILLAVLIGVMS
jgi:hypothetical protein